ncbi:MAG: iron ABC transporter permease [Flavobacteriales bacterium]|nr:iron ABC transporter permease [Flavobacteriales bacterium]
MANLLLGSVSLTIAEIFSMNDNVIMKIRLEEALIAVAAGIALSIGGLFMQSLFRNPLAGPSVLGISSGASLGVAVAIMSVGSISSLMLPVYAIVGALIFLFVLLAISTKIRQNVTLLIIGLLLGYGISALISLLEYFSAAESLKRYVIWGMGSFFPNFEGMSAGIVLLSLPAIFFSFFMVKYLDAFLLGEEAAQSLGVNAKRMRTVIILITGWLTGVVTAYCGPIAFIGLMVPHLARFLFKTASHKQLIYGVTLIGAALALLANVIAKLPFMVERIPVNIITSVLGIPVIIWIILDQRKAHLAR